jgi:hypothetical protein
LGEHLHNADEERAGAPAQTLVNEAAGPSQIENGRALGALPRAIT